MSNTSNTGCRPRIGVRLFGRFAECEVRATPSVLLGCFVMEFRRALLSTALVRIFTLPLGLLFSVLLARFLGPDLRGQLAIIMTTASIFSVWKDVSVGGSQILLRDDWGLLRPLVWLLVGSGLFVSASFSIITFVFGDRLDFLLPSSDANFDRDVILCALIILLLALDEGLQRLVSSYQRISFLNTLSFGMASLQIVLLLVPIFFFEPSCIWVCYILVLRYGVSVGMQMYKITREKDWHVPSTFPKAKFKESIKLGLKTCSRGVCTNLILRVDIWLIAFYLGSHAVGLYQVSVGLTSLFMVLSNSIGYIVRTKAIIEDDGEERGFLLVIGILLCGGLSWPLVWIAIPHLVRLVYGGDYVTSADSFRVLWGATIFWAASNVILNYMTIRQRAPLWITACMVIGLLLNLLLNALLIPTFGIVGAAWSSLISYFFVFLWHFVRFANDYNLTLNSAIYQLKSK